MWRMQHVCTGKQVYCMHIMEYIHVKYSYSGSMPGGPSPYDVNGAGGDGLYAELEPEKPDTPHTEWNDSPFTGALQGSN